MSFCGSWWAFMVHLLPHNKMLHLQHARSSFSKDVLYVQNPNELCCDSQSVPGISQDTFSYLSDLWIWLYGVVQVSDYLCYNLNLLPIPSLLQAQFGNESLQNHMINQSAVIPSMNDAPHKVQRGPSNIVFFPFSSRRFKLPFTLEVISWKAPKNWTQKLPGGLWIFVGFISYSVEPAYLTKTSQIPDNTVSSVQ